MIFVQIISFLFYLLCYQFIQFIVIDSFVSSYFQCYFHIRAFAVYIVGIEDFFASAFKNMACAAQLTSSSSVTINFVEYRLHSAQPSKLDSALVCTIFRHNPNKFGFCSRCSIGWALLVWLMKNACFHSLIMSFWDSPPTCIYYAV